MKSLRLLVVCAGCLILGLVACRRSSAPDALAPTPKPPVSPRPTATSGGTQVISASSINCDCANTEAPDIGGAASRQCLNTENILKTKATAGQLKLEVVDGKIVGGDVCDSVTAGPAAWPVVGKPDHP